MPSFDILKTYEPSDTFRAKSIVDMFTIEQSNLKETFQGEIDLDGKDPASVTKGEETFAKRPAMLVFLSVHRVISDLLYSAQHLHRLHIL